MLNVKILSVLCITLLALLGPSARAEDRQGYSIQISVADSSGAARIPLADVTVTAYKGKKLTFGIETEGNTYSFDILVDESDAKARPGQLVALFRAKISKDKNPAVLPSMTCPVGKTSTIELPGLYIEVTPQPIKPSPPA